MGEELKKLEEILKKLEGGIAMGEEKKLNMKITCDVEGAEEVDFTLSFKNTRVNKNPSNYWMGSALVYIYTYM